MRSHIIRYSILILIIFLEVIPVYGDSYVRIAPQNIFYILGGIYLLVFIRDFQANRFGIVFSILFLFYFIWMIIVESHGFTQHTLMNMVRTIVFILLASSINDIRQYHKLLKFFTILILISALFGLLIHLFGEPFASLRVLIIDSPYMVYVGKGERIVGFNDKLFTFAYPLAALPLLILTFFRMESKLAYLFLLIIAFLGIIMNGERAPLISTITISFFMIIRWYKLRKGTVLLIIFGFAALYLTRYIINLTELEEHGISRIQETEDYLPRIAKQIAAIIATMRSPFTGGTKSAYNEIFYNWFYYLPTQQPHNHFINIGYRHGIIAWFILVILVFSLLKLIKRTNFMLKKFSNYKILYEGTIAAFISVMFVNLTHNDGLFWGEMASILLLGFLTMPYNYLIGIRILSNASINIRPSGSI